MATSVPWLLSNTSHVYTGLLGATIPSSLLSEYILPPYDPEANTLLQFIEGCVGVIFQVMVTSWIITSLNPMIPTFNLSAINVVNAPYFMPNSVQKLQRWTRAIRDAISFY